MNTYSAIVTLGKDPEAIKLGEREGRKIRVVDKTYGKKAIDRWFTAILSGPDVATVDRLRKGDQVFLTGALIQEEYEPKKPRYKGEKVKDDTMPYAKLAQVVKSPTFFNQVEDGDEKTGTHEKADDSAPDLTARGPSPLDGII